MADDASETTRESGYTVLARKYRPQSFDALIGQEAMVRVLSNAFERDRIPHAIILTGVRGVGKTTTARIVAKGLNCSAADKPTITPCGDCENCRAIAESRHVDVLEMDAASRTGVGDIREIIESVRYRANQARYKVYIIDETHMLSNSAFNALLKTLEEPPPHVMFILATTDIHKVPVTVLSRCMRFDLRRVEPGALAEHLGALCKREGVEIEPDALAILARAAEGSVRDALSLLDQAIAHSGGTVTAATVADMLGLAERGRIYDLFELVMGGDVAGALAAARGLYDDSADPQAVLRELAEVCHLVSVVRAAPSRADDPTLSPTERDRSKALAAKLAPRSLSRAWQMLLKAIEEAGRAPSALAAMEMAIIRMTHIAELPSPDELVRLLRESDGAAPTARPGNGAGPAPGGERAEAPSAQPDPPRALRAVGGGRSERGASVAATAPALDTAAAVEISSFEDIVALARDNRDAKLLFEIEHFVRPGPMRGRGFEFTPAEGAPRDLASTLGARLTQWCGARWIVSVAEGHAAPTIDETRRREENDLLARLRADPMVQAALEVFPTAELRAVRDSWAGETPPPPVEDDALEDGFGDDGFGDGDLLDDDFYANAGWEPDYGDDE